MLEMSRRQALLCLLEALLLFPLALMAASVVAAAACQGLWVALHWLTPVR